MYPTTQRATTNPLPGFLPSTRIAERQYESTNEQRAHAELSRLLGSDTPNPLHGCLEIVRKLFNADAAGLHVVPSLRTETSTQLDFVSGVLAAHEHTHASIGLGLAELCFASRAPMVLTEQDLELTYLQLLRPRIVHILAAPLYDEQQQPLGAIWLAQITSAVTYSRTDMQVLERMTHDLALALKMRQREQQQAHLNASLQSQYTELANALELEKLQRDRAEASVAQMVKALSQKDTLLIEGHHRAKNTLQMASSLLSLQARAADNDSTRAALREAHERLHLLARVSELLYSTARRSETIAVAQLLGTVAESLDRCFAEPDNRVSLSTTSENVFMPAESATALVLIVNEVVTNAFKHAFPNDAHGTVSVDLRRQDLDIVLRIENTNVGIVEPKSPAHFDLSLVKCLAEQLKGVLVISQLHPTGTVVTLTIPSPVQRASKAAKSMAPATWDSTAAEVIP